MIHTIYSISIRRYVELDETKNLDLLRKWYNPFPVKWFDTESFFDEFNNIFGNSNNVEREAYKIIAYNNVLMLDAMYKVVLLLMQSQNKINMFSLLFKRKFKNIKSNLEKYRAKIKHITRIDIFKEDGIKRLEKEIRKRKDKYLQEFKKEEPTPIDFMEFAYSVFSICEISFNPEMTLFEFAKLKNRADKIIKQREKQRGRN
jgi:hypothetical protein